MLPWKYLKGSCVLQEFVSPMTVVVFGLSWGFIQNMKKFNDYLIYYVDLGSKYYG